MHSSWKSRGGGGRGFFAKFFLGGYLGLSENLGGGPLFLAFFVFYFILGSVSFICDNFSDLTPLFAPRQLEQTRDDF